MGLSSSYLRRWTASPQCSNFFHWHRHSETIQTNCISYVDIITGRRTSAASWVIPCNGRALVRVSDSRTARGAWRAHRFEYIFYVLFTHPLWRASLVPSRCSRRQYDTHHVISVEGARRDWSAASHARDGVRSDDDDSGRHFVVSTANSRRSSS